MIYDKIRKPVPPDEPFFAKSKLGWLAFDRDPYLKIKPMVQCNFIRASEELLEKKVDLSLHKSFAERPHDFTQAPSINEKLFQIYRQII